MRFLPRRNRGLHNVKTRDTANYPPVNAYRLYGFAEAGGVLQSPS